MNRGLAEFNEDDRLFEGTFAYKVLLTGVFTGAWYFFASRINFFNSAKGFKYSLPVAAVLSFYFSKGFVNHYIAAQEVTKRLEVRRKNELWDYTKELRSKNIQV